MRPSEKSIISALRSHGYRLTPQRRAVIHTIARCEDHLTPATLYDKVSTQYPTIGLVTIYRTLAMLAELGLICELHTGDACPRYTVCTPQHHHHIVCSGCGKVVDFTTRSLEGLEARLTRESGFRIDGHLLEFVGLCQTCQ
jgi:Fur family ferric uptake transcriptional regulator